VTTEATDSATDRRLSVAEVASRLGLSRSQIHAMCREGAFGHNRYGEGRRQTTRIPEAEVDAYLARTFVPAKPGAEVA
jgi:excisionase family DNA binding protein